MPQVPGELVLPHSIRVRAGVGVRSVVLPLVGAPRDRPTGCPKKASHPFFVDRIVHGEPWASIVLGEVPRRVVVDVVVSQPHIPWDRSRQL